MVCREDHRFRIFETLFKKFTEILVYMKNEGSDHQPEAGWLSYLFCKILLVWFYFMYLPRNCFVNFQLTNYNLKSNSGVHLQKNNNKHNKEWDAAMCLKCVTVLFRLEIGCVLGKLSFPPVSSPLLLKQNISLLILLVTKCVGFFPTTKQFFVT